MFLNFVGFTFIILISIALFLSGFLNLIGCGDRTEKKYKLGNVFQCLISILLVFTLFFFK